MLEIVFAYFWMIHFEVDGYVLDWCLEVSYERSLKEGCVTGVLCPSDVEEFYCNSRNVIRSIYMVFYRSLIDLLTLKNWPYNLV